MSIKARLRRLERVKGKIDPRAVVQAQKLLQAGEDPGDTPAAKVARDISEFLAWAEARTCVEPPPTADG